MSLIELPPPDSEELAVLLGSPKQQLLYGLLYRRRANPPTLGELSLFGQQVLGESSEVLNQRLLELERDFHLSHQLDLSMSGQQRILLAGRRQSQSSISLPISRRRRAEVLQGQRCAQCGHTPTDHGAILEVDLKLPASWGGTTSMDNLQALCEDCRQGKRDYLSSFDAFSAQIRESCQHAEPQKRVGELLLAMEGSWVPADLLSLVASALEYQDDWQRRLRDLRFLGWEYEVRKRRGEASRVKTFYRVSRSAPWPPNIRAAINEEETRRKALKLQQREKA